MKRYPTKVAVALTGVLVPIVTAALPLQPVFGEGGARRDVVRQEAMGHGKQGHAQKLVTHVEASLEHAKRGGKNPHLDEGITHLQEAIEHGKAGHSELTTQQEGPITHLSQVK